MICMIKGELKKCLYYPYVLLVIIGSIVLCFSANAEYDETGRALSVFRLFFEGGGRKSQVTIEHCALFMWIKGMNGWLPLILPVLLTFGYIAVLSAERLSGQTSFLLIRTGNWQYSIAKVTAGVLAGGILFLSVNILFGILIIARFPRYITFSVEEQMIYADWYGSGITVILYILKRLAGSFLYGMAASMFGIGVSIFLRDKYMLICLPFLLNYIYMQILQKLSVDGKTMANIFDFSNLMNVSGHSHWGGTVIFVVVCYVVIIILYRVEMGRRHCDG